LCPNFFKNSALKTIYLHKLSIISISTSKKFEVEKKLGRHFFSPVNLPTPPNLPRCPPRTTHFHFYPYFAAQSPLDPSTNTVVFPHVPSSPVLTTRAPPPLISLRLGTGTAESSPSSPNHTTKQPPTTAVVAADHLITNLVGAWYRVCCVVAIWLRRPSRRGSAITSSPSSYILRQPQIQTLQPNNCQPHPPSPIVDLTRARDRDWDRRVVTVAVGLEMLTAIPEEAA
jgi:hypothetical protein